MIHSIEPCIDSDLPEFQIRPDHSRSRQKRDFLEIPGKPKYKHMIEVTQTKRTYLNQTGQTGKASMESSKRNTPERQHTRSIHSTQRVRLSTLKSRTVSVKQANTLRH